LGPLWAGSTITMPYLMFGAMLGLLGISMVSTRGHAWLSG
jgi:hypothetical protein